MKLVKRSVELLNPPEYATVLDTLERAIRNCYKSEDRIGEGTAEKMIKNVINRGHTSTLEHCSVTYMVTCDRSTMAQWTRHRIASYSIQSMRYCNYATDKFGKEIAVIAPKGLDLKPGDVQNMWYDSCLHAEDAYLELIAVGVAPEVARSVLPQCVATTMVCTMNFRELRAFFELRCDRHAQEDIREISFDLLRQLADKYPAVFDEQYKGFTGGLQ